MAPIKVTLATVEGEVIMVPVESTAAIATLAPALCSLTIPTAEQALTYNGHPLQSHQSFESAAIADGDLIMVEHAPSSSASPASAILAQQEQLTSGTPSRDGDANNLNRLHELYSSLRNAMQRGDTGRQAGHDSTHARQREIVASGGRQERPSSAPDVDPISTQAQEIIAERIRQENVMRNFEDALEHNPESFGSVVMLFVDCKVNGHIATAFVDSGAQATIISKACAERCNILRLLDTRFAGVARGVGTARIFGRIHLALLDVAGELFEVSFTVMEDQSYDMLLGLDMLRKHQATIDLRNNCLRMGSSSAPFLPEHRIPYHMRALADAAHSNPAATVDTNAAEQNTVGGRNLGSDRGNAFNSDEIISQTAGQAALIRANKQKADALVVLGFSRSDADRALIACDGHQDRAAMLLIEEKFGS